MNYYIPKTLLNIDKNPKTIKGASIKQSFEQDHVNKYLTTEA
jgi:hypothetical protein